jgi:MoxR-like ATPase
MLDQSLAWNALQLFREELRRFFKERGELVDCGLTALIANAHLFILGPPGTAKSMTAQAVARGITGAKYFYVLLNKFLTWRDLACGEVIVREESDGDARLIRFRNSEGPLLGAHLVFFDELFKASGATLNSLLNLLNERIYTINAGEVMRAPLLSVIAASNEMPGSDDEHLRPFADRFLLWYEVDYISISHDENTAFIEMLEGDDVLPTSTLTLEDLVYFRSEASRIPIDRSMLGVINSIRATLKLEHRIEPSDRRYRDSLKAIKAYAFLNGHATVKLEDLAILEHILWAAREPEVRDTVRRVVREFTGENSVSEAETLYRKANELFRETLTILEQADREIPFDEPQRQKREQLRNDAWSKERQIETLCSDLTKLATTVKSRRASALMKTYLNEVKLLRKALVHRRGVEDPFVGVGYAHA